MTEKLHKVLARAGLGSRRHIEIWIEQGRVTVNGRVAAIGARVDAATDELAVDGRRIEPAASSTTRLIAYHKPTGELVTRSDPNNRPTVFQALPEPPAGRWIAVGRLDINTSGLLLLTNDGELANRLMHPRANIDREYVVRVHGEVSTETLHRLKSGVSLDGRTAAFKSIKSIGPKSGANRTFRVILTEGRNREVRRLWEAMGCSVNRLKRVRFGPVTLPGELKPGAWKELDQRRMDLCSQDRPDE